MSLRINPMDPRSIQDAVDELERQIRRLRGEGGPVPVRADLHLKNRRIRTSRQAVKPTDIPNKAQLTAQVNSTTTTVIQQAGANGWYRMNQSLTGTQNGANRAFTLPHLLLSGTEPTIYHNFARLTKVASNPGSTQFTRAGEAIVLGLAPASGDIIAVDMMTPQPPNPVLSEALTGTKNNSNTTFTLKYEPSAPQDLAIYHGATRVTLTYGTPGAMEFGLSGKTVTLGTAPRGDDTLVADYSARRFGVIRWGDEMEGVVNGLNTTFTLDEAPYDSDIGVYFNGIRLEEVASSPSPTQYSRVGRVVELGLAPSSGDSIYADYVTPYGGKTLHEGPGWMIGTGCGDMIATTRSEFEQV